MDHLHHAYRTLTEAPRFAWPDAARIAFTAVVGLLIAALSRRPVSW